MKASVSSPKCRHVCNINSRLQTWSAYTATVFLADPAQGYKLIGYQSIVAQASSKYQTSAWLKYDRAFRYFASRTTSVTWDTIDHHMWAQCFTGRAATSITCYTCSQPGHVATDCAHTDQSFCPPTQATTSSGNIFNPSSGKPKICRLFNAGRCKNQASPSLCKYRHECFICHDDHPEATSFCTGPINKHKPDTPLQPDVLQCHYTITLIVRLLNHCFGHHIIVSILATLVHVTFVYLPT